MIKTVNKQHVHEVEWPFLSVFSRLVEEDVARLTSSRPLQLLGICQPKIVLYLMGLDLL